MPEKTKFPLWHFLAAVVATAAYVWTTYRSASADAFEQFGTLDGGVVSAYIQGQFIGAFSVPTIVCAIAYIPKGRNLKRIVIAYWVTCVVMIVIGISAEDQLYRSRKALSRSSSSQTTSGLRPFVSD